MSRKTMLAQKRLAQLGIRTADDLVAWAHRHGLLGAYIEFRPATGPLPGCWQVIRQGHQTDPDGPAWQQGNKTFIVASLGDKHRMEQAAAYWAEVYFQVPGFVRIEGLGNVLFPSTLAAELKHYEKDLTIYRKRQHTHLS